MRLSRNSNAFTYSPDSNTYYDILHAGNYSTYAAAANHNHNTEYIRVVGSGTPDGTITAGTTNSLASWANTTGSTGYPGQYGQSWLFGGAGASRNMILWCGNGANDLWFSGLDGNGAIIGWCKFLDSSNYTNYAAASSHTHSYLPLSGGTVSGSITTTGNYINTSYIGSSRFYKSSSSTTDYGTCILDYTDAANTYLIFRFGYEMGHATLTKVTGGTTDWTHYILDSGNYSTYITPAGIGAATAGHTHSGTSFQVTEATGFTISGQNCWKVGNIAIISFFAGGTVTNSSWANIATAPSGYRPTNTAYITISPRTGVCSAVGAIQSDGRITATIDGLTQINQMMVTGVYYVA